MHPPTDLVMKLACTTGVQDHDNGWRMSLGIAIIFAAIFAIGSACLPDTPASMLYLDPSAEAAARKVRGCKLSFQPSRDL